MTPTTDPRCECGGVEAHDVHLSGCPAHEGTTPATPRPFPAELDFREAWATEKQEQFFLPQAARDELNRQYGEAVNAYDQLRASEADSKALIERMQGELIAIREQRITLREENARLTQARDIRTAHFEEVARLRAEHAKMRALLAKTEAMFVDGRIAVTREDVSALTFDTRALLAKVEAK